MQRGETELFLCLLEDGGMEGGDGGKHANVNQHLSVSLPMSMSMSTARRRQRQAMPANSMITNEERHMSVGTEKCKGINSACSERCRWTGFIFVYFPLLVNICLQLQSTVFSFFLSLSSDLFYLPVVMSLSYYRHSRYLLYFLHLHFHRPLSSRPLDLY